MFKYVKTVIKNPFENATQKYCSPCTFTAYITANLQTIELQTKLCPKKPPSKNEAKSKGECYKPEKIINLQRSRADLDLV